MLGVTGAVGSSGRCVARYAGGVQNVQERFVSGILYVLSYF